MTLVKRCFLLKIYYVRKDVRHQDSMLLSIDNNKSMNAADKAAARVAVMTAYATGKAQPTLQPSKGTAKGGGSIDSHPGD